MPRSKPKAQRLAPPVTIPGNATALASSRGGESVRSDKKHSNLEQRHEPCNPAKRHRRQSLKQDLPTSQSKVFRLGNATVPADPVVGTLNKTKERTNTQDGTHWFVSPNEQRPTVDHLNQMFVSRNVTVNHSSDIKRTADVEAPRSSSSCSSSDTASIGLAEDIPQPESIGGMPRHRREKKGIPNPYKHNNIQTTKRTSNNRVSNNLFEQVSGSKIRKTVEADSTPPAAPPSLGEVPICYPIETVTRNERHKFSFVADDEAKSVFDHGACKINSEKVKLSRRNVGKDRLRDYWNEIETVSIRNSSPGGKTAAKNRQSCMKVTGKYAPSLHPHNRSEVTNVANVAPLLTHSEILDISKKIRTGEAVHPITEENLDGGDAIPVTKHRKRKSLKKAKSGGALIGNESKDGDNTASSTGFSESDGQACMECGSHGKASKMVLCDTCSDGCHTFCMRPARTSVPLGVWICPKCHMLAKKHEVHLSKLSLFLENHGL